MSSIEQDFGSASFPIESADVSDSATFPDEARSTFLALFSAAITAEFADAWETVRSGTSLDGRAIVHDSFPGLPTAELLLERKTSWPCLFLDRVGSGEASDELEELADVCPWDLTLCLGPLRIGDAHKFSALLKHWIPKLIHVVCRDRCHPAYNDGVIPFGPGGVAVDRVEYKSHDSAAVPVGENKTLYYGVTIRFETTESVGWRDGEGVPFLGSDHSIAVGGKEGLIPNFMQLNTNFPAK